jgi:hypothetical protein
MPDRQNELNNEILSQLKNLDSKIEKMAVEQAVREERYETFAENFKLHTQHISELMGVLTQGKTAAKLVAGLIAVLAGLGATWDWLVAHIRIM